MVKRREEEGGAFKNIALARTKLRNFLEAALADRRQDDVDDLRQKLAKVIPNETGIF